MLRSETFVIELRLLEANLRDLVQAQNDLPNGAHIDALFQIAIMRIEEQIATLKRVRSVANVH